MTETRIDNNLKKKELKELLEKVKKHSDCFSIVRYYEGNIPKDEFQHMQESFYNYIMKQHEIRIDNYLSNLDGYKDQLDNIFHFHNQKQAMDYLEDLFNQEMNVYKSCEYCEFEGFENKALDIIPDMIIKKEFTRISPVTIGPVFEIITLPIEMFDEVTSQMKKLFSTYKIFGGIFEDLCCYYKEEIILKICSHENYAILYDDMF